jgi:hypothetical protein
MAHYFLANHDRRFVLIASPKCASRAVRQWFLASIGDESRNLRACDRHLVGLRALRTTVADYEWIQFVRDPLRRLVGFYLEFVVPEVSQWKFADDAAAVTLEHASFGEMVDAIAALRRDGLDLQHHLVDQVAGVPFDGPPVHLALVERLDAELVVLGERFGVVGATGSPARRRVDVGTAPGCVARRPPTWFRSGPTPSYESFYDEELADRVRQIYADDVALHASIAGAQPLLVG